MKGQANHGLLDGATSLGSARTEACYELVDMGAYPALVAGGRGRVKGELYRVDQACLLALDRLEGHPSFYHRAHLRLEDGRRVSAYLLLAGQAKGRSRIASGDWRAHGGAPPA